MSLLADIGKQGGMHFARSTTASGFPSYPKRRGEDTAGPVRSTLPEASQPIEGCPIWFAALMATSCLAGPDGENRALRWDCVSGRALYTNRGGGAERIEPL